MRIPLVIAAVGALVLQGCSSSRPYSPCAAAPRASAVRPAAPVFAPCAAPRQTPAPALAANPVRLAFPVARPVSPTVASTWSRSAPVLRTTAPVAAVVAAPVARSAAPIRSTAVFPTAAPAARPSRAATVPFVQPATPAPTIVAPVPAAPAAHADECEECPGGVCGVPPPR